jgi:D-xylose transport system substrate-binding protein
MRALTLFVMIKNIKFFGRFHNPLRWGQDYDPLALRRTPLSSLERVARRGRMLAAACRVRGLRFEPWTATSVHPFINTGVRQMSMTKRRSVLGTLVCGAMFAGSLLGPVAHASKERPEIGFSIDDLRVERWARDRDYFVEAATKLGAKVSVQSADASEARQIAQIENMISRGMDVIVIVPFNSKALTNVVAEAKRAGIKVLSYDRLILDADVDAYISFDNHKVGEMQAQGVLSARPKGNYFLLGGSPTDNNAKMLREGQMKVLQPAIDRGDIKVVGSQWVPEWNPSTALSIMENALTANANKIDAVVASNDGTAGGAIQALAAQRLAGKVPISGQDADLAAVKRVIAGTQTMTVYKPLKQIATSAAQLAVDLAKGNKPAYNSQYDNGRKKVDTVLLQPTVLTKSNIDLVVKDGLYTQAQISGK